MTSKAGRRRRKVRTEKAVAVDDRLFTRGPDRDPRATAPAWQDDPRERVRRLPAFMALELCGAIDRRHREAGDLFAMRYRLAIEHAPAVVASYCERGGHEVDEEQQDAARRWVRSTLKLAGPAGAMLEAFARDERLALTEREVIRLKIALEQIAKSPA